MAKKNNSSLGKSNDDFIEFDYTDKHKAKNKYVSRGKAKNILKQQSVKPVAPVKPPPPTPPYPGEGFKDGLRSVIAPPMIPHTPKFAPAIAPSHPPLPPIRKKPGTTSVTVDDQGNKGNPSGTGPGPLGGPKNSKIINVPTKSSIRPIPIKPSTEEEDILNYESGDYEKSY